jgi:CheY-like chemotaxis protein
MSDCATRPVERVLYIEDSPINAKLMSCVFARMLPAVDLVTAPDGESGLALLAEIDPAVVLLDCHLPDMSGLEVLEVTRARGNDVPVVAVTADASAELESQMVTAGAEAVLTKPFEISVLTSCVAKHLSAPTEARESSDDGARV